METRRSAAGTGQPTGFVRQCRVNDDFSDTALVLAGHGTTLNPDSLFPLAPKNDVAGVKLETEKKETAGDKDKGKKEEKK